jgi:hypothetical protein
MASGGTGCISQNCRPISDRKVRKVEHQVPVFLFIDVAGYSRQLFFLDQLPCKYFLTPKKIYYVHN